VLALFNSYMTNRTQQVQIGNALSNKCPLKYVTGGIENCVFWDILSLTKLYSLLKFLEVEIFSLLRFSIQEVKNMLKVFAISISRGHPIMCTTVTSYCLTSSEFMIFINSHSIDNNRM
jgi:hypothetical protein